MTDPTAIQGWMCPRCYVVRAAETAPWCGHYAPDLPKARMVPLPDDHPHKDKPWEWYVDMPREEAMALAVKELSQLGLVRFRRGELS